MSACNARLIACQAQIPVVERWGGGMVVPTGAELQEANLYEIERLAVARA
jgi:hypothetical protein